MGVADLASVVVETSAPTLECDGGPGPRRLELDGVTFRYAGTARPALDSISVTVPPGTSLGVVGPSGAGKSTLIDVICGLRTPETGQVSIDGRALSEDLAGWRRSIGLVPQEVYLVDGSVRRNVAFGLPEDDDRVWEALERAQLADFVRELPGALDSVVGERGTRLSGGQGQRLGIARALYGRPSVLVLDEATAALDVETEHAVVQSIRRLRGQLSVIVVAHRLSTIRRCDAVAYLDEGRLRAVGSFDEVAGLVPEFARAVQLANLSPREIA